MEKNRPWCTGERDTVKRGALSCLLQDNAPANGVILIPVFSISNGTRSSMMCHLNSGTCLLGISTQFNNDGRGDVRRSLRRRTLSRRGMGTRAGPPGRCAWSRKGQHVVVWRYAASSLQDGCVRAFIHPAITDGTSEVVQSVHRWWAQSAICSDTSSEMTGPPDVPSACAWVIRTASIRRSPYLGNHSMAAAWKLLPTSMMIVLPAHTGVNSFSEDRTRAE